MVVTIGRWCHRIGGDGIDAGAAEDAHPGPAVVFHAHADTYGDSSNDAHDKYDSKHNTGNRRAREDIPNIGVVGATIGRGPITAVRSAVFATLSKTIVCEHKEQNQLWKQDPWTAGQPSRVHPSRWPEVARQASPGQTDRQTDWSGWERRESPEREGDGGDAGDGGRSDGAGRAPGRGVAQRPGHCPEP